ncbi:MAG: hypothetical protein JXN60_08105 [Lentisphaerae bacterium]|nr:hypothetical protein [Lentisphaerota bacterium]
MAEFPFELRIKNTSSENGEETLFCTALIRTVPGRRHIYDARWNDTPVIAKMFSHKLSARRHLNREVEGLSQLQKRQLNSAKPLFYGRAEDGRWVVVIQKIMNSVTALNVYYGTEDNHQKMDLVMQVGRELAKQHSKGIIQKDMHLENFLQAEDQIYTLDPGQIRFSQYEIPRRTSLSQLALLVCYVPAANPQDTKALCEEYFKIRSWDFEPSDKHLIDKLSTSELNKVIRHGLKKCLRTSKRFRRMKTGGFLAIIDRGLGEESELVDFITQIDCHMDTGQILKNGNTCYVSRVKWAGMDIVVKRYNHKGFIHSLRHTIKRSRARRGWLHAHHFSMHSIPTPKPLAYIEQRKGPLVWKSYLVTQYTEGPSMYQFLRDKNLAAEERENGMQQVKKLLDQLEKYHITHGDLKHTNILMAKNGPMLMDLDSVRYHKCRLTYRIRRARDRERFEKNECRFS